MYEHLSGTHVPRRLAKAGFRERLHDTGSVRINYVVGPDNGPPLVLVPAQTGIWESYLRVLVPLSTGSGEELEGRVGDSSLVEEHAELAETLIWFVIPLAVVAVVGYWLHRRGAAGKGLVALVALGAVVLSGATLVDVAMIGHSGAKASWSKVSDQPASPTTSDPDD